MHVFGGCLLAERGRGGIWKWPGPLLLHYSCFQRIIRLQLMKALNYSAGCDWAWGGERAGQHGGEAGWNWDPRGTSSASSSSLMVRVSPPPFAASAARLMALTQGGRGPWWRPSSPCLSDAEHLQGCRGGGRHFLHQCPQLGGASAFLLHLRQPQRVKVLQIPVPHLSQRPRGSGWPLRSLTPRLVSASRPPPRTILPFCPRGPAWEDRSINRKLARRHKQSASLFHFQLNR